MPTPAESGPRRVVFPTREVLKQHYEANLAHHGLVIPSAEPLRQGTELDVQLVLPDEAGTLVVTARVVAAQEAPAAKRHAYELQLQLLDFDEEKHVTVRAVLAGASPAPTALLNLAALVVLISRAGSSGQSSTVLAKMLSFFITPLRSMVIRSLGWPRSA